MSRLYSRRGRKRRPTESGRGICRNNKTAVEAGYYIRDMAHVGRCRSRFTVFNDNYTERGHILHVSVAQGAIGPHVRK